MKLSNAGYRLDLEIVKGDSFAQTFTYKVNGVVTNISGYTFTSQIRTANGTLASSMTCVIANAAQGLFSVSLTDSQTSSLSPTTQYKWSLEVNISGTKSTLVRGDVMIIDETTI